MNNVQFIPHSFPTIGGDDIDAVINVLKEGQLDEGKAVVALEEKFKKLYNVPYAVAVSTGFAAIHLSLIALDIKAGDEVIIPSYTCAALLNPVLLSGATPVIADVEANSFNLSVNDVRDKITAHTKAIIVPHIFGFPARIDEIMETGIPVIEDCAQSIGGQYKGKKLGQFGDLSIFSFYASKMICGGDGGMIITNNESYYNALVNYRYYGHKKLHRFVAYNYHLTNLPAALVYAQMSRLDSFIAKRRELAGLYDTYFNNDERISIAFENKADACYYRYPVRIDADIEQVRQQMKAAHIGCGYGVLEGMHQMQYLTDNAYPNTTRNLNSILSIPIYPKLDPAQVKYIAEQLKSIIKSI